MSGDERELSVNYGFSEEPGNPDAEPEEASFASKAPYIKNNDKATDYRSTGYLLTVFGGAGILFVILTLFDVIPKFFGNPYMSYGILFATFVLFLVMGLSSIRGANIFEKKAKSDHTLEDRIVKYVSEELTATDVDEKAGIAEGDTPEIMFFKRNDCLKNLITKKFVNIDPDFLDNLIDEKLYDSLYEESEE
ncbi:MAG: hypothetical protein K6E66_05160 [Lachnospiraceae bacterium]|jgi:hypothetical protein|nr:hypothetical protein [Lachnospiraceae bacterium]